MSFSFGCRVNEAEKQVLDTNLTNTGFSWNEKNPDFYIINTCVVTNKAEREVRQHIYQIRKKYPSTRIIATGCSATLWLKKNTLLKEVDYWIDNTKKTLIPELLSSLRQKHSGNIHITQPHDKFLYSGRMMIKIQDGCNRYCSYCIVPLVRGKAVSRKISDIIFEIQLSKIPIHEVILTAINTEYFGNDTGETLMNLVDSILMYTKIERVSFGSIHPWSITPEFLAWYKNNNNNPRFVHFFHIPIQSGSDTILKLMNRQCTQKDLMNRLTCLHSCNPQALIATDVIVGFPGETEVEFAETYDFLKRSPISKFHVFRYSHRPDTASQKFFNEVTHHEKRKRAKILLELGKKKYSIFLKTTTV